KRLLAATGFDLAFRNRAVALERSVLKYGHDRLCGSGGAGGDDRFGAFFATAREGLVFGYPQNFFGCGDTQADQTPAVLGQRAHAGAARGGGALVARTVF